MATAVPILCKCARGVWEDFEMSSYHRRLIGSRLAALVGGLAVLGLAACAEPTPYAPRTADSSTGYTDQQLAANRYRITFTGNSVTSRETVENYLLLHSAEVTERAGYPYFVFDTRNTAANTTYYSDYYSSFPTFVGFHRFHHGFHSFAFFPEPFGYEGYSRPITRYQAYAEIVLLSPEQAKSESRALSARDVISHLQPAASQPASAPPSTYR